MPDRLVAAATPELHANRLRLVRHAALAPPARAAVLRAETAHALAVVVAEVH